MKNRLFSILLCLLLFVSCGRETDGSKVFAEFEKLYDLPPGIVLDTAATERDERFFSPDAFELMFAGVDGSTGREYAERCIAWLSTSSEETCEADFFFCADPEAASIMAGVLMTRADMMVRTDAVHLPALPQVRIFGNVAVLLVLPDMSLGWRAVERALR